MGPETSFATNRLGRNGGILAAVALGAGLVVGACSSPSPSGDGGGDASSPWVDSAADVPSNEAGVDALPGADGDAGVDAGDAGTDVDADAATGVVDATEDTGVDALDASPDATLSDAFSDASVDASLDALPYVADSAPNVCGDGVRGPATEECDHGAANVDETGACSTTCQVQDFLASSGVSSIEAGPLEPFQSPPHTLGQGRHPVAAGLGGFAVIFLEEEGNGDYVLRAEAFDPGGVRLPSFPIIGTPGPAISNADPVVAPISTTQYVAVWEDAGTGLVGPGIAMAVLDTTSGTVGPVVHANASTESPEVEPDALWVGGSLVVAWTDHSGDNPEIKYRTFDGSLSPTSGETYLASPTVAEVDVTLAPFNGGWAAAWKGSDESGAETVHVKAGSTELVTGWFSAGQTGERPALAQVGAISLFVAFSMGVPTDDAGEESTTVLRGAVVDMTQVGTTFAASEVALDAQADGGDSWFPEGFPAEVTVGGQMWLGAWTGAQLGDPLEDELWLAPVANTEAAQVGTKMVPMPRWFAHRAGDQESPALGVTTLAPNGALVAVWADDGVTIGGVEARPDVVVEVVPLPLSRRGGP